MSKPNEMLFKFIQNIAEKERIQDYEIQTEERGFTGDNFLGEILKVKLIGMCDGVQRCLPLIVKNSPKDSETRQSMHVTQYYNNEIYVYCHIIKAFEELQNKYGLVDEERLRTPKMYGFSNMEMKEFVILEDLSYDGFKMTAVRAKPVEHDHMVLVVKNLAKIHALSFVLKEEYPVLFKELSKNIPNTQNYGDFIIALSSICVEKTLPKLKNEISRQKLSEFREKVRSVYEGCLNANNTDPYNAICHGDAFRNNYLFKYMDGEVIENVLIDWQMIRFAAPVTDLTYALCLSSRELTKYLPEILILYYETLSHNVTKMGQTLEKCYPKAVFDQQVKDLFLFGLVFAIMSIPFQMKKPGKEQNVQEITNNLKEGDLEVEINEEVIERVEGLITDFVDLRLL